MCVNSCVRDLVTVISIREGSTDCGSSSPASCSDTRFQVMRLGLRFGYLGWWRTASTNLPGQEVYYRSITDPFECSLGENLRKVRGNPIFGPGSFLDKVKLGGCSRL